MSMGGILKYPENGDHPEILSMPEIAHTLSGYLYDGNEEENLGLFSDLNTCMASVPSNVICFQFCSVPIKLKNNNNVHL